MNDDEATTPTTRRRALRALAAAGTAGLSGTAGCLGFSLPGLGGGDSGSPTTTTAGTDTATTTAAPNTTTTPPPVDSYLRWLPAPREFGAGERYSFNYYDAAAFRELRSALHPETFKRVARVVQAGTRDVGVKPQAVEALLAVGTRKTRVVFGSFAVDPVRASLSERGFGETGTYGDFRLFARSGEEPMAVAVREGTALVCRPQGEAGPRAVARTLVDAGRGNLPRYVRSNPDFSAVARPVVGGARTGGGLVDPPEESEPKRGQFAGHTALGFGYELGETATGLRMVLAFESADAADPGAVRTWTEEGLPGLSSYRKHRVSADGATVTVTGTVPTGKLDFLARGEPGE